MVGLGLAVLHCNASSPVMLAEDATAAASRGCTVHAGGSDTDQYEWFVIEERPISWKTPSSETTLPNKRSLLSKTDQ